MEKSSKSPPGGIFGINLEISAYLDLATCLLIVAFLFYPAPFAGLLDAKFLAIFGFALVVFMFAGRGILAMLTVVAIEMLGLFAKNSNSRALGALYDTARGFFFYNFVAFVEGFFWMALFGLLYIAHLALAPAFAKGMLEPMAYESFSLLKQYRILGIAPENEYPFFTFLLFFMASTFFGLFAVKKFNISLASGAFQIMREAKYGKGDGTGREKYEVWVRAYVRQEKLD